MIVELPITLLDSLLRSMVVDPIRLVVAVLCPLFLGIVLLLHEQVSVAGGSLGEADAVVDSNIFAVFGGEVVVQTVIAVASVVVGFASVRVLVCLDVCHLIAV